MHQRSLTVKDAKAADAGTLCSIKKKQQDWADCINYIAWPNLCE